MPLLVPLVRSRRYRIPLDARLTTRYWSSLLLRFNDRHVGTMIDAPLLVTTLGTQAVIALLRHVRLTIHALTVILRIHVTGVDRFPRIVEIGILLTGSIGALHAVATRTTRPDITVVAAVLNVIPVLIVHATATNAIIGISHASAPAPRTRDLQRHALARRLATLTMSIAHIGGNTVETTTILMMTHMVLPRTRRVPHIGSIEAALPLDIIALRQNALAAITKGMVPRLSIPSDGMIPITGLWLLPLIQVTFLCPRLTVNSSQLLKRPPRWIHVLFLPAFALLKYTARA
jgi:hypothetical protein